MEDVERTAQELAAAMEGQVDWDRSAGEQWAMLGVKGHPVGYLAVRAPLIVIEESVRSLVQPGHGLAAVVVPSMDAEVMSSDLGILLDFLRHRSLHPRVRSGTFLVS
jgi:hypothetical protein